MPVELSRQASNLQTFRVTAGRSAHLSYARMSRRALPSQLFGSWRAASIRGGPGSRTQLSRVMSPLTTTGGLARSTADENRTREGRFEGPATRAIRVTAAWYPVPGSNWPSLAENEARSPLLQRGGCLRLGVDPEPSSQKDAALSWGVGDDQCRSEDLNPFSPD